MQVIPTLIFFMEPVVQKVAMLVKKFIQVIFIMYMYMQ